MVTASKSLVSSQDIFKLEQDVMAKLNAFNQTYATYMRCGNTGNSNQKYLDTSTCPNPQILQSDVDAAKQGVDDAIAALKDAMATNASATGKTPPAYDRNYNVITNYYYDNMLKKRKNIDNNLAELYNTSESTSSFYNKMYMSTMYSKIVLTVLATSIIYYTIMKLRNK
jgi:hypothetical protein